jgi:uncharacterized protein YqeY
LKLDDEGNYGSDLKAAQAAQDALEEFTKGKRDDLVAQTKSEIALLLSDLPKQLSSGELKEIVKKAMDKLNNYAAEPNRQTDGGSDAAGQG